ncbi:DUF3800 domain-containing protein [Corynebacterium sp. LK2510]|uniref:DUF3800 domain-containing protein n=1 Tax=Corynebacterium sp. LK2510 TaxID=3110472 RepID=UPI0034CE3A0E
MLLAYIDEIGQPGAFVSLEHKRFSDGPAFGYGGFLIPDYNARAFGAIFTREKRNLFPEANSNADHEGRWEWKGSDLLFARAAEERPQNLRVLGSLIRAVRKLEGRLFYYAEEKALGTPKETNSGPAEFRIREEVAMRETLNRLARHADTADETLLVMMDQINEKSRLQRLPRMYSHILGRASDHDEMRRIIEPPMHIDSKVSANIQFADWISALVKRAIEYQLVENSRYSWVPQSSSLGAAKGAFTHESKLKLFHRATDDLHHSQVMYAERPVVETNMRKTLTPDNRAKLESVRRASLRHASSNE